MGLRRAGVLSYLGDPAQNRAAGTAAKASTATSPDFAHAYTLPALPRTKAAGLVGAYERVAVGELERIGGR
ncbi:MAG: hypothetical protein ACI841_003036 [Planctomycetota bacterium]|jgi:hypothetical protein